MLSASLEMGELVVVVVVVVVVIVVYMCYFFHPASRLWKPKCYRLNLYIGSYARDKKHWHFK